jgi:hypothetical protein
MSRLKCRPAERFLKSVSRDPKRACVSFLHELLGSGESGRKRLWIEDVLVSSSDIIKRLIAWISAADHVEERVAVGSFDERERHPVPPLVLVLVVVELLHHVKDVDANGKFRSAAIVLLVEGIEWHDSGQTQDVVLAFPTELLSHARQCLHEHIGFEEVHIPARNPRTALPMIWPNPALAARLEERNDRVVAAAPEAAGKARDARDSRQIVWRNKKPNTHGPKVYRSSKAH